MLKSNVEGFIIKNKGERIAELDSLTVSFSPEWKEKELINYLGQVKFEIKNNIELPSEFDIIAVMNDKFEKLYIANCGEVIKISDKEYRAKYDINNIQISDIN